jgi:transposase
MPRKAQPVSLPDDERRSLTTITRRGSTPARVQARARILLLLHRGQTPEAVAAALQVGVATVFNIKRRYLSEGLAAALHDKPRSGKPPRIDGAARARITALACSDAPRGHARWTLRLLADKAVELGFVERVSHNTVKEVLKKTGSSRTSSSGGASGR